MSCANFSWCKHWNDSVWFFCMWVDERRGRGNSYLIRLDKESIETIPSTLRYILCGFSHDLQKTMVNSIRICTDNNCQVNIDVHPHPPSHPQPNDTLNMKHSLGKIHKSYNRCGNVKDMTANYRGEVERCLQWGGHYWKSIQASKSSAENAKHLLKKFQLTVFPS